MRTACFRFSSSLLCLSSSRRHRASRLKFSAVSTVAKMVPSVAAQVEKLLAVSLDVVHEGEDRVLLTGASLGRVVVDAGSRRHVEAFGGVDVVVVVDADEGGLIRAQGGGAGRAMGLVADHQIEARGAEPLGLGDGVDRLVGGEDHRHRGRPVDRGGTACQAVGERRAVRGGRDRQVHHRDVLAQAGALAPLADLRIRADREGAQRHPRLSTPLHERLRQQRDGGHQEQDPATGARHGLRNAKGREGLAGAARHDELAPVRRGQSGSHRVQGSLLVLAQAFAVGANHDLGGLQAEGVPVDRGVEQVLQADPGDWDGLTRHRLLRRGVPVLRGGYEQPGGELARPRLRQEGVDVALGDDACFRVIELALDGAQLAGLALAGHQVDAAVRARAPLRPVAPHPHLVKALRVARIREKELAHQALEGRSLAARRPRVEVQAV